MNDSDVLVRLLTGFDVTEMERESVNGELCSEGATQTMVAHVGWCSRMALEEVDVGRLWKRQWKRLICDGVYRDYVIIKQSAVLLVSDARDRLVVLSAAVSQLGITGGVALCLVCLAKGWLEMGDGDEVGAAAALAEGEIALDMADRDGDIPRQLGCAKLELGAMHQMLGNIPAAFAYYQSASETFALTNDPMFYLAALNVTECALLAGEAQSCADGVEALLTAIEDGEECMSDEFVMQAHILRARAYWLLGYNNLALSAVQEAKVCADRADLENALVYVSLKDIQGKVLVDSGSFEVGLKLLEEVVQCFEDMSGHKWVHSAVAKANFAYGLGVAERFDDALAILSTCTRGLPERGKMPSILRAWCLSLMGGTNYLRGDMRSAKKCFSAVLSFLGTSEDVEGLVAHAKFHLSLIAGHEHDETAAGRLHEEAIEAVPQGHWVRARIETGKAFLLCAAGA